MNAESKKNVMIKRLKESNYKRPIKLRTKKLAGGAYSIYLDIWHDGRREYRFLKLYITGDKLRDDEAVRLALSIRDKEEKLLHTEDTSYNLSSWKKRSDFIEYFSAMAKQRDANWQFAHNCFAKFISGKLPFTMITATLLDKYRNWLINDSGLKRNTAWLYYSKLSAALNQAVRDDILTKNPAAGISITTEDTERPYLTIPEIQALESSECPDSEVKRAFLFSCYTGLRLSDILGLRWQNVSESHITIIQQKTKKQKIDKLLPAAIALLSDRGEAHDHIFNLPAKTTISRSLNRWIHNAGIEKSIGFHTARHSFAMLALKGGMDIYTLMAVMGHQNIQTTMKYAKMNDTHKEAAMDKLSDALSQVR